MPIYVYRCDACGHQQDVLQKISDPLLTTCPECGRDTYQKQVTAAGFRLKGTGWYETDFRGGPKPPADAAASTSSQSSEASSSSATTPSASAPAAAPSTTPTSPG